MALQVMIAATADDGYVYSSASFGTGSLFVGEQTGYNQHTWLRFAAAGIAQGAAIAYAYLVMPLRYGISGSGDLPCRIYGMAEDDHAAPTTRAGWTTDEGLHTTAYVDWTPTIFNPGSAGPGGVVWYSPDISTIIQEIVNRANFAADHAIGLHLDYTGNFDVDTLQRFLDYTAGNGTATLVVVYSGDTHARPIGIVARTPEAAGDSTSQSVNLPDGMVVGETLIAIIGTDGSATHTWPAGWNEIRDITEGNVSLSIAWHKVDGNESSPITVTTSSSQRSSAACQRFTNAADPDVSPPQCSAGATGASANPAPDTVTPSGGDGDYTVLACFTSDVGRYPTAWPTGFANGGGGSPNLPSSYGAFAYFGVRLDHGSSFSPGTFTASSGDQWCAATVAIYPASAPAGNVQVWGMAKTSGKTWQLIG